MRSAVIVRKAIGRTAEIVVAAGVAPVVGGVIEDAVGAAGGLAAVVAGIAGAAGLEGEGTRAWPADLQRFYRIQERPRRESWPLFLRHYSQKNTEGDTRNFMLSCRICCWVSSRSPRNTSETMLSVVERQMEIVGEVWRGLGAAGPHRCRDAVADQRLAAHHCLSQHSYRGDAEIDHRIVWDVLEFKVPPGYLEAKTSLGDER
jgi:hypothetical protein